MRNARRLTLVLGGGLVTAGCAAWMSRGSPPVPSPQAPRLQDVAVAIRPLPGGLDDQAVFNSNSPEVVDQPGILLSTLPPIGSATPSALLDFAFEGRFELFSHHIARDLSPGARLLYLGYLATNRTDRPVTLRLRQGASYLSQPDAPFVALGPVRPDPEGAVFAGPGDRVATDLLHDRSSFPLTPVTLPSHSSALLAQLPIPTRVAIGPPVNGRTTQLALESDGPVSLSEVAVFAQPRPLGGFEPPTQDDYVSWLASGSLAGPREATPSSPTATASAFRYGRVAGVSQGAHWLATISLQVPATGSASWAFPVAAVSRNGWGTGQTQSARMRRRYPDTAWAAHGNYGVTYALSVTLANPTDATASLALSLTHPLEVRPGWARYQAPPKSAVTFRGPVRVDAGDGQQRYVHLVLHAGEDPGPFDQFEVGPHQHRRLGLSWIQPADATPPQLLVFKIN